MFSVVYYFPEKKVFCFNSLRTTSCCATLKTHLKGAMMMNYPWLYDELASKPGVTKDYKVEWQWTRYQVGGKLFAAICRDEDGQDSLVTLKLDPAEGAFLRDQYADITPGYYMNKEHWNSVNLNGAVPDNLLKDMVEKSYRLVLGGLSKKVQREILEGKSES